VTTGRNGVLRNDFREVPLRRRSTGKSETFMVRRSVSGTLCGGTSCEEGCTETVVGGACFVGVVCGLFVAGVVFAGSGAAADGAWCHSSESFDFVSYPISHSLLLQFIRRGLLGAIYSLWKHDFRSGVIVGMVLPTHWLLDYVSHRADMPIYPGGQKLDWDDGICCRSL
jgi:hypothetical protein